MAKESFYNADKGLHVDYICNEKCNSNNYVSHFHEDYEIIFFFSVTGDYVVENRKYSLEKNDILLIKPTKYHYFIPQNNSFYERIVINVAGDTLDSDLIPIAFSKGEFFHLSENSIIAENFRKLKNYGSTLSAGHFKVMAKALLTEIILLICGLQGDAHTDEYKYLDEFNTNVVKYINQNLPSITSLEQLANDLFVSKSTLYHAFKRTMKISVMQYVRNKKVLLAQSLIKNGVRPTKACAMSGFEDYTTFYRSYKLFFGHSPNDTSAVNASTSNEALQDVKK
jgi:AraC-like DNA-binding protein